MHSLHAVADVTKIEAAISSLPPGVKRLLAAANVDLAGKRIGIADLDRKLASAERMSSVLDRLTLKVGLARANLIEG